MKKLMSGVFLFMYISSVTMAQIPYCGTDRVHANMLKNHPSLEAKENTFNSRIYQFLTSSQQTAKQQQTVYTIPVVFHIMHQNGPENISDAAVQTAVTNLNLRFQNAPPFYDSTGHVIDIQFCLASIDPQGNPTMGITRDSTPLTFLYVGDDALMKSINLWDPHYYFNVWTVQAVFGFNFSVSGYSTLPVSAGDSTDGVVIQYQYADDYEMTHEAGHYLGLYHTWTNSCTNYNCMIDGDQVCDTPPDTSAFSFACMDNACNTDMDDTSGFNPFITDMNDLPNFMDYTTCPLSFTQGQGDRMTAALTQIRQSLLQSFGCGFVAGTAPAAQMSYTISSCNDGIVYFSDSLSTGGLVANWDFDNDGIIDNTGHNVVHTFPMTGNYTVKLVVTGQTGSDSAFQTIFVQKAPSPLYPITVFYGYGFTIYGDTAACKGSTIYAEAPPNAQSYLWSNGDTTQTISFVADSAFTLWVSIVDSNGLSWSNQFCKPANIPVADPPPSAVIATDSLDVCQGDTITFTSSVNDLALYNYNWFQNSYHAPNWNDTILHAAIPYSSTYQLILTNDSGCYSVSNYIFVNAIPYPGQQFITQNGFQLISSSWWDGIQWYLNGTAIPGATGDTLNITQNGCYSVEWYFSQWPGYCTTMSDTAICFTTVPVIVPCSNNDFHIFYQPEEDNVYIQALSDAKKTMDVIIVNAAGQEIVRQKTNNPSIIYLGKQAPGIYFIRILQDNRIMQGRFFVSE